MEQRRSGRQKCRKGGEKLIRISQLKLPITHTKTQLEKKIAKTLKNPGNSFTYEIRKQSLDCRHKNDKIFVYTVDVTIRDEQKLAKKVNNNNIMLIKEKPYEFPSPGETPLLHSPVIVGSGPAGLFCGWYLAKAGYCPIILERGEEAEKRQKTVENFWKNGVLDPESNVQFGEGGAGTFSDGKLMTGIKKDAFTARVLQELAAAGAPEEILYLAKPHIGTDKLPRVIENIREQIKRCGGEVHFETRMDAFIMKENEVIGIETNTGKSFYGPVILATGHSARDVYNYLYERQIQIEAKGIAVGVRLEHPQELIDQIQYHRKEGRGKYLPAAEYSFVTQANNRGVYSFCMCPGGFVVPAASGPKQVVVNGMSPSNRGSRWSNSGMVVEIRPEDYSELVGQEELYLRNGEKVDADSPLALMAFQERLEEVCWLNGGMKQTAPAQRMDDFMRKKNSFDLPVSSYTPGLLASPLHFWMPEFVTSRLREGFRYFGKVSRGFLTNEATMIGVETRTSAPVRILRDRDTYQHVTVKGLFPCGEGAGYAGGIVSAAIDGERCAEGVYNLESNK